MGTLLRGNLDEDEIGDGCGYNGVVCSVIVALECPAGIIPIPKSVTKNGYCRIFRYPRFEITKKI